MKADKNMEHENKIRKILFNEISLAVAAIGFISSLIFWVQNPQQDLKLEIVRLQAQVESNESVAVELSKIKNNDLHELQLRMQRIEDRQILQIEAIARVEALLKR